MFLSFFRTIILYISLIIAMRIMGKRQIGELDASELVVSILIADLAAVPMQDPGIPLFAGLVPIAVLIIMEILISFFSLKSRVFRRLISGQPAIIIRNGTLDIKKVRNMRITTDEIIQTLRKKNIYSISDVKYGVIEPDGSLTAVLARKQQPLTAEMMNITPKQLGLPMIIISDGRLVPHSMEMLSITEKMIQSQLEKKHLSIPEVFLMTADDSGNYFIQTKEEKL